MEAHIDYGYRAVVGALLLLVGLGIFARLMFVRTRLLFAGQPETRWDLVIDRAKTLLRVGIGQRKMFKEPASGLMHAFTFWGFCVLGIRTTQLFFQAFMPDVDPLFLLQHPYDFFKDITEVIVLMMVCGFIYRRLVVQPARIHYSGEAVLILGFIGTLMVSDFLYDGLHFGGMAAATDDPAEKAAILDRVAGGPIGSWLAVMFSKDASFAFKAQLIGEAMYWLHLVIILTFLNLLPVSKHFHVITALPNVFLSRLEPKGALAAVDNIEERIEQGERLGIGKVEDLSWKQMLDLYTCTECGRCTVNCPAWNTDKPLSPAYIIKDLQVHLYDEKDRLLAPTAVSGDAELPEGTLPPLVAALNPDAIWSCTTCRSCSEQCPVMIEHVDKIVGVRRHLMMNHNSFPAELAVTLTNLENKSNPWGIAASKRDAWAKELGNVPTLKENPNPEYLYFVGCAGALDDRSQKVTQAVVTILRAAGVDYAIMGKKEKCSGDPARRMGHEYLFQESARENIETMKQFDIRKVITTCPHCFNTIKNEYPQLGGEFVVVHHTELIKTLLAEGKLSLKDAGTLRITYHDSCYMGRYNDVYEEPRDVLGAVPGIELVEMERSGSLGMCCGAGGARMFMEESIGGRVNQLRVDQAMQTKPEVVATNCPWCMTMIKDGLREKEIDAVVARDVAEIVADALILPEPVAVPEPAAADAPAAEAPAAAPAAAAPSGAAPVRKRASKKKKKKAAPAAAAPAAAAPAPSEAAPATPAPAAEAAPAKPTRKKASKKKKKKAAPAEPAPAPAAASVAEAAPAAAPEPAPAPEPATAPEPAPAAAEPSAPESAAAGSAYAKPRRKKASKKKKKAPTDG